MTDQPPSQPPAQAPPGEAPGQAPLSPATEVVPPAPAPDAVSPAPADDAAPAATAPTESAVPGSSPTDAFTSLFPEDRPEIAVGAAFAGGLVVALILKRLAR